MPPVALDERNFNDFTNLLEAAHTQNIMPADIGRFIDKYKQTHAFTPITRTPDAQGRPRSFGTQNPDIKGGFTEMRLFTATPQTPDNPRYMAMLYLDILPITQTSPQQPPQYVQYPRRWLVGNGVQALMAYQMSCCAGTSAVGLYHDEDAGGTLPVLLENRKFMKPEYQDLFRLRDAHQATGPATGLNIDPEGKILTHWYNHMREIAHDCASSPALSLPHALKYKPI